MAWHDEVQGEGFRGNRTTAITGLGGLQMRDVLHGIATALVIAIAALCTVVQLSDVQDAVDRLRHDDSAVQQVGPQRAGQRAGQDSGQHSGR